MRRTLLRLGLPVAGALALYLFAWPVEVEPVAWQAPQDAGYTGVHDVNDRLAGLTRIDLAGHHGPEDLVADADGNLYAGTEDGLIVRVRPARPGDAPGTASVSVFADVGGRPLGMEFDAGGGLLVANAYLGLQRVAPDGDVTLLTDRVNGTLIGYADDLDVAPDGRVYFSDASTRFTPARSGGTYSASLPDILEHGGHGRLLVYDPADGSTAVLLDGLQFANGVAVAPQGQFVLVAETGSYRVLRVWLKGGRAGERDVLLDNLPGFPDNLNRGLDGRFWVGLVSPRSALLDALSGRPFVRKMVQRLPAALRPAAQDYSHVVAFDASGTVQADLQSDGGILPAMTGVLETRQTLYFSTLFGSAFAQLDASALPTSGDTAGR